MDIGNATPGSLFEHAIEVGKGTPCEFEAVDPASGVTLYNGRVASLKTDGTVQLGLASGASMPLWINGVTSDATIGNLAGKGAYAYVGGATVEIGTTEYDATKTYNPTTCCTCDSDGKVIPITDFATEPQVLHVSRGILTGRDAFGLGAVVPADGGGVTDAKLLVGWTTYQPIYS